MNLDYTNYDIDYESPDGIDNCMTIYDYLHEELWNEYIDDPCLLLHLHYLGVYQTEYSGNSLYHPDIFKAAREAFTPTQVIALYHYSNFDVKRSRGPIDRKLKIIKALKNSDNLLEYNITDVLEFQENIENMHPILFQDFTDILYDSGIMRYMCPEDNNILSTFERNVNYAKKNGFQEGRIDSYNSYTILECSYPNIISTGSKFLKESVSKLVKIHNYQSHFFTETITMDKELVELSKKHPSEVFNASRHRITPYDKIFVYYFEYVNGFCRELARIPGYKFSFGEDEIQNEEEWPVFREYVLQYLNGLDVDQVEDVGFRLDKLNNLNDRSGDESYDEIIYESDNYIWTAKKIRISYVSVSVEKKEPGVGNPLELEN